MVGCWEMANESFLFAKVNRIDGAASDRFGGNRAVSFLLSVEMTKLLLKGWEKRAAA